MLIMRRFLWWTNRLKITEWWDTNFPTGVNNRHGNYLIIATSKYFPPPLLFVILLFFHPVHSAVSHLLQCLWLSLAPVSRQHNCRCYFMAPVAQKYGSFSQNKIASLTGNTWEALQCVRWYQNAPSNSLKGFPSAPCERGYFFGKNRYQVFDQERP